MIESYSPPLMSVPIDGAPMPPSLVGWRVYRECGCSVYLGVRYDRRAPEAITVAVPCQENHKPLVTRFNDLMRWSLANGGTDRPLAEVVEELLAEAATEVTA